MILRKEEMTLEIGFNSTVAFPLFSAFTIDLNASFNILLPISLSLSLYPERPKPLSRTQSHSESCEVWGFLILSGILDIRINSMDIFGLTNCLREENVMFFFCLTYQVYQFNNFVKSWMFYKRFGVQFPSILKKDWCLGLIIKSYH